MENFTVIRKLQEVMNQKEEGNMYEALEKEIMNSSLNEDEKTKRISKVLQMKEKRVNIMLVGTTGAGKSSTINALFNMEVARVGMDVNPETSVIEEYELDNLTIWDTPGLGDSIEKDKETSESIVAKLNEKDQEGNLLIDLVVLILDSSSKDLGMIYKVINDVLKPCFGDEAEERIIIGLNQADVAMKGKHWKEEENAPDEVLMEFLSRKAESIRERVREDCSLDILPICYCAGYVETDKDERSPYNLSKLLYYIINLVPAEKRMSVVYNVNPNEDHWLHDDMEAEYSEEIKSSLWETIKLYSWWGSNEAEEVGEKFLGIPGKYLFAAVGGVFGAVEGFFSGIFG